MTEIRNNAVDQRTYESNAQMLGAQRDTVRRKDLGKSASETSSEPGDQVELGQNAGTHTGATQDLSGQAQRLAATRAAMAKGNVQAGDVAPGQPKGEEAPAAELKADAGLEAGPQAQTFGAVPPGGMPPGGMPPGGMPFGAVPPGGVPPMGARSATEAAQAAAQAQQDAQQAQTIYAQMAADRQKAMMQMWKIMQDLQTSIFQMMQDAMAYRQQVMNKFCDTWDQVLRG